MYIWPISLIKYKVFPLFPYIITSICKFMISLSTDFQICGVHVIDKALSDFLIDVERCSVCTLSLIRQRGSSRSFWEVLESQSCQQWSGYCVFWPCVPSPVFWKFYLISFCYIPWRILKFYSMTECVFQNIDFTTSELVYNTCVSFKEHSWII